MPQEWISAKPLASELSSRSVSMDPVSMEQTLNALVTEQEPFGKVRIALRGLRALSELGDREPLLARVLSEPPEDAEDPDEEDPDWMLTPERAAYPIRLSGRERAAVELDPGTATSLESALRAEGNGAVQTRNVEVWLSADDATRGSASRVAVHIGAQCIGQVAAQDAEHFRPVLEAAAERDEDPMAEAHLTRIPGETRHVLDLPLPQE